MSEKSDANTPVFCVRSRIKATGGKVQSKFSDGSPAIVTKTTGKGKTIYCAFLPSLSYYKPAIPLRPVDRGASDDAMIHFLPTEFDPRAARLIALPAANLKRPVTCSQPLVETTVIRSKRGVVIPLINWTGRPLKNLRVHVMIPTPGAKITLASGRAVQAFTVEGERFYMLDLDAADALIFR